MSWFKYTFDRISYDPNCRETPRYFPNKHLMFPNQNNWIRLNLLQNRSTWKMDRPLGSPEILLIPLWSNILVALSKFFPKIKCNLYKLIAPKPQISICWAKPIPIQRLSYESDSEREIMQHYSHRELIIGHCWIMVHIYHQLIGYTYDKVDNQTSVQELTLEGKKWRNSEWNLSESTQSPAKQILLPN